MFELERIEPSAGLRRFIERHWVWCVPTKRDSRMLDGIGWAVGTKLQPGAFTACTGIDSIRLTNTRLPVA